MICSRANGCGEASEVRLRQRSRTSSRNCEPRSALETLTDETYFREPVPGCWNIRPVGPGGRGEIARAFPAPQPETHVTTIAWWLLDLAVNVIGLRVSHHFGDGSPHR